MIPVVNTKYKYIFFYSAKAGCTSLRKLYLLVHGDELSEQQNDSLDKYHNVNEIHPYDVGEDYSDYFKFVITRNPYSRIVSAYLDQFVYARNKHVHEMVQRYGGGSEPDNFREFLELLVKVPDEERDSHFQTQAHFAHVTGIVTRRSLKYRFFGIKPPFALGLDFHGDIRGFRQHMTKIYQKVFRFDKVKLADAIAKIGDVKKNNSSFYGEADFDDAARLSVSELDEMVFAPKPQDFLRSPEVVALIEEIYAQDFQLFGYKLGDFPNKYASPEINQIPEDLDWQMYIRLSPDLLPDEVYNERCVVRHYLEFGRHEKHLRAYKIEAPEGFDWQRYLSLHADLPAAGITTESAAIEHYISYGIREERAIK